MARKRASTRASGRSEDPQPTRSFCDARRILYWVSLVIPANRSSSLFVRSSTSVKKGGQLAAGAHRSPGPGGRGALAPIALPMRIQPRLEDERVPHLASAIADAGQVLADGLRVALWIEHALALEPAGREEVLGPGPQRPAQPLGERDRESPLGTVDPRTRKVLLEDGPEKPLAGATADAVADLQLERQPPRELEHSVVEERDPSLQADAHGRTVDLGEDVVGQVEHRVPEHHALDEPERAWRIVVKSGRGLGRPRGSWRRVVPGREQPPIESARILGAQQP